MARRRTHTPSDSTSLAFLGLLTCLIPLTLLGMAPHLLATLDVEAHGASAPGPSESVPRAALYITVDEAGFEVWVRQPDEAATSLDKVPTAAAGAMREAYDYQGLASLLELAVARVGAITPSVLADDTVPYDVVAATLDTVHGPPDAPLFENTRLGGLDQVALR